nr:uncharacterized protein LOC121825420 isoform X3 [Peromyscus maniculatus bairdii]
MGVWPWAVGTERKEPLKQDVGRDSLSPCSEDGSDRWTLLSPQVSLLGKSWSSATIGSEIIFCGRPIVDADSYQPVEICLYSYPQTTGGQMGVLVTLRSCTFRTTAQWEGTAFHLPIVEGWHGTGGLFRGLTTSPLPTVHSPGSQEDVNYGVERPAVSASSPPSSSSSLYPMCSRPCQPPAEEHPTSCL